MLSRVYVKSLFLKMRWYWPLATTHPFFLQNISSHMQSVTWVCISNIQIYDMLVSQAATGDQPLSPPSSCCGGKPLSWERWRKICPDLFSMGHTGASGGGPAKRAQYWPWTLECFSHWTAPQDGETTVMQVSQRPLCMETFVAHEKTFACPYGRDLRKTHVQSDK